MRRERFVNNTSTTLDGAITDTATSVAVVDGSGLPAEGDYRILIDSELMLVTHRASNTLTVVRGTEGTTAAAHNNGATVFAPLTAGSIQQYIDDSVGVGTQAQGGSSHRKPFRLLDIDGNTLTASDFTWINQDSSTITDDPSGVLTVVVAESGTQTWKILHKASPTPPYKLTVNMMFGPGYIFGAGSFPGSTAGTHLAVGFREASTGKLVLAQCRMGALCRFFRFTDPATFSAAANSENSNEFEWEEVWIEIEDDNTDLIYRVSMDGLTYFEAGRDPRTAFMAGGPDQLCWAIRPDGEANGLRHLRAWIEE